MYVPFLETIYECCISGARDITGLHIQVLCIMNMYVELSKSLLEKNSKALCYTVYIMLNKNTLGIKKCKANKKQPYLCATKSFDIS